MSVKLEREYEVARVDEAYEVSVEGRVEWVMPKPEHTFYGVERGFEERPTFLRCLPCGKVVKYSQRAWDKFSVEHGEMCRETCEECLSRGPWAEPCDEPCPSCGRQLFCADEDAEAAARCEARNA